ncbi:ABC-2 transporter permease [Cohnella laeviribosi]|uniref:ABC-2 transporter permease n=1 Tax=Cohnella laeviribosi TaxID=380174 RepID=UPI003D241F67
MINLVRKELFVLSYYHLFAVLYVLVFGVFFETAYSTVLLATLPAMMLMTFASNLELRSKSELLVGSLPVRREQIVLAKYVCLFYYVALGLALGAAANLINRYVLARETDWSLAHVSIGLTIDFFFFSLYYPFYYWFGQKGAQFVVYVVLFLATVTIVGFSDVMRDHFDGGGAIDGGTALTVLPPIGSLALLLVSYRLSVAIFRKKDLNA